MAVSIADIRNTLDRLGLKYHEFESDRIGFLQKGENTDIGVLLNLDDDGAYVRFRSIAYLTCAEDHPNFPDVMAVLARANQTYTAVRFSWDKTDGEIMAEANLPLEDNPVLTERQIEALYAFLCMACDEEYPKISPLLAAASASPPKSPPETPSPTAMPPVNGTAPARTGMQSSTLLAWGVMLLGIAAVGGVVWLFVH